MSIPRTISLVILLIIYILSIKNIINKNKNYDYMDYVIQNINNEIDNFAPIIGLGLLLGLLGGGYSGSSGEQRSSTLVYDKDGNIDWIMTGVQQDWENEHIYNKKKE